MFFSDGKVAQMAAFFLNQSDGKTLPHLKLIKLLYLSDRESMRRYDVSMSDDRAVSMPHGPVLSATLDLIKGFRASVVWNSWVSPLANNQVNLVPTLQSADDLDELSECDVEVLSDVWARFGHMSKFELVDFTHEHLPEWHDPGKSSIDIDPRETFQAFGQSVEEASKKAQYLQERKALGRVLAEFI